MTQEHPITPPPELVKKWVSALAFGGQTDAFTQAARWGADQELEACCEWVSENVYRNHPFSSHELHTTRRPKPPSLKEQALDELNFSFSRGYLKKEAVDAIRRALESLPD